MPASPRHRPSSALALGSLLLLTFWLAASLVLPTTAARATTTAAPQLGVYVGPAARNIAGATAFESFSGAPVGRLLDFLPHSSWLDMTRIGWVLTPYAGSGKQLELSVPMLSDSAGTSLGACARGDYDVYWRSIATSIVSAGLPGTVIRPGWEMNGGWFRWAAAGQEAAYAGCFRSLVTAMRSVPGQRLRFDFSVANNRQAMSAETAYPGDAYVDEVSLDVYDQSWAWYPTPAGMTTATAQTKAWNDLKTGSHGLDFWASFARSHVKPLGISEWGLCWRGDGHGGGDDPAFVDRVFDFATDPVNRVSFMTYFNSPDSDSYKHDLSRADTVFPQAALRFRARSSAVGTGVGSTPTSTPTTTASAPTTSPSAPTTSASAPTTSASALVSSATPSRLTLVERPRLRGTQRVGHRLRVVAPRTSPRATSLRYQWYRDGRPARGATAVTYRVSATDRHARLRVRVVARRTDHLGRTAWTAPTSRLR